MTIGRTSRAWSIVLSLLAMGFSVRLQAQTLPGAPVGLSNSVSGSTVVLLWQEPASGALVQQYVVEAGSVPGASNVVRFYTGSSSTSVVATNVPDGTYHVRVRSVNAAGESVPSNEVAVTVGVPCSTPTPPANLAATVTGSAVQLAWTASSGPVVSYSLEVGSVAGGADLGVFDLGSAATSFVATNVFPATYYVRARARSACGVSGVSNEATIVVAPTYTGPARLEIVNAQTYTAAGGEFAGQVFIAGEVRNTGGVVATGVNLETEVFYPSGERYFGVVGEIAGHSRRLASGEMSNATIGPGETGCFWRRLTDTSRLGRFELRLTHATEPTTELSAQLEVRVPWRISNLNSRLHPELLIEPTATNRGTVTTYLNHVVVKAKDRAGRVLACSAYPVSGPTSVSVPGLGTVTLLKPGETAYPSYPRDRVFFMSDAFDGELVEGVTAWPLWKQ
jgi:hypothetical protein